MYKMNSKLSRTHATVKRAGKLVRTQRHTTRVRTGCPRQEVGTEGHEVGPGPLLGGPLPHGLNAAEDVAWPGPSWESGYT